MTKDEIIREIKRTAIENGGSPLGRRKFKNETGIREGEWYGKYWARWNDALQEAGFEINQLTQPYEEEFLLEKYTALIQELGRVPVTSELKLKRRSDKTFPDAKVFGRFGNKKKLLTRALEYTRERKFDADFERLLLTETTQHVTTEIEPLQKIDTGFVYLLKSGRHYKIGRTKSMGRREYELGIKIPVPPKTIHSIETDDPIGVEAYWHKRFSDKRGQGEWFELSAEDIRAFKRWKRIV